MIDSQPVQEVFDSVHQSRSQYCFEMLEKQAEEVHIVGRLISTYMWTGTTGLGGSVATKISCARVLNPLTTNGESVCSRSRNAREVRGGPSATPLEFSRVAMIVVLG